MERTEQNLDRLTDLIGNAAVLAHDLGLDELDAALRDLATAATQVPATDS